MAVAGSIVLVVEDDPSTADLLRLLLDADGCTVECIADGRTALARIDAGGIDLVLLDLMLPRLGGLELCRHLRAHEPEVYLPVIMVTALTDPAQRRAGFAAGADDYVAKPFDSDELLDRIRVWLGTRAAQAGPRAFAAGADEPSRGPTGTARHHRGRQPRVHRYGCQWADH
jgi:DNA-binding response OmpR family regulator